MPNTINIITKKRDGEVLTTEEIKFFVDGIVNNTIPDYQASAFFMAAFINGLNHDETVALTEAYVHSGETIDLSSVSGITVDKHSTGGVGDKTTIVLAPLVAAAGCKLAKISGRGMGHSGGTIDKFKAFHGMSMELDVDTLVANVKEIGVAISGQTASLVPADKKIYQLRDVTATIANTSMITASIMSKKLASGADAIVLDVKTGSGSFQSNYSAAIELAENMVAIGKAMGKKTVAIVSNMAQPLGREIGNINEVKEAIDVLRGGGPNDVKELCMKLGSEMLMLSDLAENEVDARKKLQEVIQSGAAIDKLRELVVQQGGNGEMVDNTDLFDKPTDSIELISEQSGYVSAVDGQTVGNAAKSLGAGRKTVDSTIDMTAGIHLNKKCGEFVEKGEVLATLQCCDAKKLHGALDILKSAYTITAKQTEVPELILSRIG